MHVGESIVSRHLREISQKPIRTGLLLVLPRTEISRTPMFQVRRQAAQWYAPHPYGPLGNMDVWQSIASRRSISMG